MELNLCQLNYVNVLLHITWTIILGKFCKKNPFDLNIFLSHMKYGRKIKIGQKGLSHSRKVVFASLELKFTKVEADCWRIVLHKLKIWISAIRRIFIRILWELLWKFWNLLKMVWYRTVVYVSEHWGQLHRYLKTIPEKESAAAMRAVSEMWKTDVKRKIEFIAVLGFLCPMIKILIFQISQLSRPWNNLISSTRNCWIWRTQECACI